LRGHIVLLGHLCISNREVERSTFLDLGLRPQPTIMSRNNTLYDGQAYTCALILLGIMEPLKNAEEFIGIPHIKTHTIVLNKIHGFSIHLLTTDFDATGVTFPRELQRVRDQVHIHLLE